MGPNEAATNLFSIDLNIDVLGLGSLDYFTIKSLAPLNFLFLISTM